MTIDEIIQSLTAMKSVVGVNQFTINEAIETMQKYQKFQDQSLSLYMERLKADMVAMLTEIRAEIEEYRDGMPWESKTLVKWEAINYILEQIIDKYKAETEVEDGKIGRC